MAETKSWTDYSRFQSNAEEIASSFVDQILTDGGNILWQKYLERKAFGFAADAVTTAMNTELDMCFVPHDPGEGELGSDWELEEEPEPGEIDSWARMYLPMKQVMQADFMPSTATSGKVRLGGNGSMASTARSRKSAKSAKNTLKEEKPPEPRAAPLPDEHVVDEEEERLRHAKADAKARQKDKEKKAKQAEAGKEEQRKKVEALHAEMAKRPHTFDNDGNIIWIEDFKPDRLPKVQQAPPYNIKLDAGATRTGGFDTLNRTNTSMGGPGSPGSPTRRGGKPGRSPKGKKREMVPEYTDGFSKLQYGQPPIIETMEVQSGVVMQCQGKTKQGSSMADGEHMSRKDYVKMAEAEVAGKENKSGFYASRSQTSAQQDSVQDKTSLPGKGSKADAAQAGGYPSGDSPSKGPPGAAGGGGGGGAAGGPGGAGGAAGGAASGQSKSPSLPPISGAGSGTMGRSPAGGGGMPGMPGREPVQKAPKAPPGHIRGMKSFQSLGYVVRPPRFHAPALGGPTGFGPAHPPLGATMGHGLVRHGSLKEDYFFPAPVPDLPIGLLKSASEAGLPGSGRRGSKLRPPSPPQDVGAHGKMLVDEGSHAYRNFRNALFPDQPSTSGGFGGQNF